MKRSIIRLFTVILIIFIFASVCGCSVNSKNKSEVSEPNTISSLEVWSAAGNPLKNESYFTYRHTGGNEGKELDFLNSCLNYISKLNNDIDNQDKWAYRIFLSYTDENGKAQYISASDEYFPNRWQGFVKECNSLSADSVLTDSTEKNILTPGLLTALTGYNDDDLTEGTLQDMIDKLDISLYDVTSSKSRFDADDMKSFVYKYGYVLHKKEIEPYFGANQKPVEKESSETEFIAFINVYLGKVHGKAVSEIKDKEVVHIRLSDGDYCEIMQTENMTASGVVKNNIGEYVLSHDAGECGLSYQQFFYYSKDFKYIITAPNSVYDLMPFIE